MSGSTKDQYLAVAASMVRRHVAGEPAHVHLMGHIRLAEVAQRLGVTRASLYRAWGSQQDFWHDLVLVAASSQNSLVDKITAAPTAESPTPASDFDGLLRGLAPEIDAGTRRLLTDPAHLVRVGLAGYPADPTVGEAAAQIERRGRVAAASRLAGLLRRVGRRPVSPLVVDDLVVVMAVFVDGAVIYGRTDPSMLDARLMLADDTRWTLLGVGIRALLAELTEPGTLPERGGEPGEATVDSLAELSQEWTDLQRSALAAGIDLFVEHAASPEPGGDHLATVLGHVNLARVARAAGVTRRHMYHLWPGQREFLVDLVDRVAAEEGADYRRRLDSSVSRALSIGDPRRLVLEAVDVINAYRRSEQPPPPGIGFALQPHVRDPGVRDWSRARVARGIATHRTRAEVLSEMLSVRPIDGVEIEDIAALTLFGAAGSERLHRGDPTAIRYDVPWRGGHYSTYAIANQALIDHLTVPDRPSQTSNSMS